MLEVIDAAIERWERRGAPMKHSRDVLAFALVCGATKALRDLRGYLASAGEAGTATTPKSDVVHEHATAEGGDAPKESR